MLRHIATFITKSSRTGKPAIFRIFSLAVVALVVAGLAFSVAPSQNAFAAGPFIVNTTSDSHCTGFGAQGAPGCTAVTDGGGRISLRSALEEASTAGGTTTITLPAGTYNLSLGDLVAGTQANTTITIQGAGAATTIINQTTAGRMVIVVNYNVNANVVLNLTGVTISGGSENENDPDGFGGNGGAILAGGSASSPGNALSITNAIFSGNFCSPVANAGCSGGAISMTGGGNLTVSGSTFSGNTASKNRGFGAGGAIYFDNGGNGGNVSITSSTFTNNVAQGNVTTGGQGGAVRLAGGAGSTYTVDTNTFTGNAANGTAAAGAHGGALYLSLGSLTAAFNRIVGNTGADSGGLYVANNAGSIGIATDNWWGCNGGPGASPCDIALLGTPNQGGSMTVSPWIVLTNTASPNPIQVNQTTTLTADFLHNSTGGSLTASQVSVLLGLPVTWGSAVKGSLSNTQTTIQSNGTATATFTASAAGAGSAGATVDSGTGTASITINKADTTTTLTSDTPDPTVTGQSYVVNFTMTSNTGTTPTAPTGTVTVSDGTDSCSGTIASGTCTITSTTAGSKSLTATYNGDSNFNTSTSTPTPHTVNKADTTTTLSTGNPNPSVVGQPVTFAYSVTVNSPGSGTPTGSVTVTDGADSCTGTVAAGSCSIAFPATGNYAVTATYAGDANYNASPASSAMTQTVNKADTTTTIISDNPDPSTIGQAVTVNFTVAALAPGAGTPTGSVTVSDGVDSCSGSVSTGTCSITLTTAGSRTLTATYAGDSNFNGSTSAGEPHTVNLIPTTTAITLETPDPSVVGQPVIVQYTVSPGSGTGTPTGSVTVSDGTVSCTATVAAGQCSLSFTSAGAKSLTATYAGDSTYQGSTSAAVSHQVNKADTTTTITSDTPDPSQLGAAVTVNYTVTVNAPGAGTLTGSVTVTDGVDSCTGTVAAGMCSITLNTSGARTLTATYAGDSNFNSSTSAGVPHTVGSTTTTTITSDNPDPSVVGQAVIVQYSVTPNSGTGTPTGNVTVTDGTISCSATVAAGQCSLTFTTAGARTLTAAYPGDSTFSASTSAAASHQVNSASTTTTITSETPDPSSATQAVTVKYTVSVISPGAGTPTGSVTVSDGTVSCIAAVSAGQCALTMTTGGVHTLTATYTGDSNFNPSTSIGVAHTVDATPPDTTILTAPANPSSSTSASFTFTGSDNLTPAASLTFQCSLDGAAFSACTSPAGYSGLALGSHTFQVRAIDGVGNVDPTPASFTWTVQAVTTLLYNGDQIVIIGSSFKPAALLSSPAAACVSGQPIAFRLDRNPTNGSVGSFALGTATTGSSGQATLAAVGTTGWQEGVYTITAIFSGTTNCVASSYAATLTVGSSGDSANGGGWYTLSGSGRINFGFTVSKVDNTCTTNCAYKGQLVLINNGKWRLKGTLSGYVKTSTGTGSASGTGDLFWWNQSLNGGLGDWALAKSGVSFTASFYDSGNTGKSSTDTFGINIVYTPVSPQPSSLPNSTPQLLKGGNITVK